MSLTTSPLAPDHFPELPEVKGVTSAVASRGFYAGRGDPRDDVFLFAFQEGTVCAGVFTRSSTRSVDIDWCRDALKTGGGQARALVANSGNSNAFTGLAGREKNDATIAALVDALGVAQETCFLAATGVIGQPLADPNFVGAAVPQLAAKLAPPDWLAAAKAFMTTDTFPKGAGQTLALGDTEVAIAGIAKGSGMIQPNMATMLAYVFTDAAIAPELLDGLLRRHVDTTFNAITVDSDTSTSDTLMVFATGAAGHAPITEHDDPRLAVFSESLHAVLQDLAHQIVRDGEGATKFIEITVGGAQSEASAKTIAASIANSPLVKTALAASDANWGRVVMAIGKTDEPLDRDRLNIWFGDHQVAENGGLAPAYDEGTASAICAADKITIRAHVGVGDASATVWTCDLTHAYVEINGAYRT
ncbi:MAG: bifunctional glutamate N-acetyltransferase/amino-acid acetyltransferase ArgJ [Hyphomonadaceae bacterium]